jgi:hypothetical protein
MFLLAGLISVNQWAMPMIPELLFFSTGFVLLMVNSFRTLAHRRAWKRSIQGRPRQRYKMPLAAEVESRLYFLGALICWAVSFPDWELRAFLAALGLATVFMLLYRNNLKTKDATPYDTESVLQLPSENVKAL